MVNEKNSDFGSSKLSVTDQNIGKGGLIFVTK